MAKYDATAARAHSLIARKGGSGIITRVTQTDDPIAQTVTETSATASFVGVAAAVDAKFAMEIYGSLVDKIIARVWVSNYRLTIHPAPGDKVRWAGTDWIVKWTRPIDPAGDGVIVTDCYLEG